MGQIKNIKLHIVTDIKSSTKQQQTWSKQPRPQRWEPEESRRREVKRRVHVREREVRRRGHEKVRELRVRRQHDVLPEVVDHRTCGGSTLKTPWNQGRTRPRVGDEPPLHRKRIHAAHLGKIHSLVNTRGELWWNTVVEYCGGILWWNTVVEYCGGGSLGLRTLRNFNRKTRLFSFFTCG